MKLFEYVDNRGDGAISKWHDGLEVRDQAIFDQKLRVLRDRGIDKARELKLLAGPLKNSRRENTPIYKLHVKGTVQLRTMLCKGPFWQNEEITLLLPAVEKGSELVPKNAVDKADERRQKVWNGLSKRRAYVLDES